MPTAVIGIGLPGSGKTTKLKPMATSSGAVYICPDEIRFELTGDARDQSRNASVWRLTYERVISSLRSGHNIVLDATNAKLGDRKEMIMVCRSAGAEVHGIWFATSLTTCLWRNEGRDRMVPESAIRRMAAMLNSSPPTLREGFNDLIILPE
jgi:predicted kinase